MCKCIQYVRLKKCASYSGIENVKLCGKISITHRTQTTINSVTCNVSFTMVPVKERGWSDTESLPWNPIPSCERKEGNKSHSSRNSPPTSRNTDLCPSFHSSPKPLNVLSLPNYPSISQNNLLNPDHSGFKAARTLHEDGPAHSN